jgi:tRNA threonylcarbamoyladenosine biosynthesis protein TsaE
MIFFKINSEEGLIEVAREILKHINKSNIILLEGDLGSGKTTLCSYLLNEYANIKTVTSPSFGIVNIYSSDNQKIFHYDLYRIKSEEELYGIEFEQSLNDGLVLIEWPEIAKTILDNYKTIKVKIDFLSENSRYIKIHFQRID